MSRADLLKRLDARWQELLASYAGLSEAETGGTRRDRHLVGEGHHRSRVRVGGRGARSTSRSCSPARGRRDTPSRTGASTRSTRRWRNGTGVCRSQRSCGGGTTPTPALSSSSGACRSPSAAATPASVAGFVSIRTDTTRSMPGRSGPGGHGRGHVASGEGLRIGTVRRPPRASSRPELRLRSARPVSPTRGRGANGTRSRCRGPRTADRDT